ncbi:serine-tRNA ligase [Spizellomyces punctatus DAOM BR117]|uniref:serine--tRNA ligase n=1 Tax=Spizellomyces punctatus (strain DAOM BR117) TaxID=645134 RepID=A0A0L0H891_SPIPD|nr:serine-tRNA ligase [Spizellomyces punctatus DAOM BR117]KNC97166.1 serine-tRNA ligase [Spizellomyces punctatus DAOM BR117]|eukprot:XP_016605206.1 serine-tRNA ligase [Spizellomyces punctatus DAOM BR117]
MLSPRKGSQMFALRRVILWRARPFSTGVRPASRNSTDVPGPQVSARQFNPHLNYRYIRENAAYIQQNAINRNVLDLDVSRVVSLYDKFVTADFELAELRRRRNKIATEMAAIVGILKKQRKDDVVEALNRKNQLAEEGKTLKKLVAEKEEQVANMQAALYEEARHIPNDTHPSVPIGDESKAGLVDTVGSPRAAVFDSGAPLRDHMELASLHDMVDFERAGKATGSSFYYLRNAGALLEMALTRYAIDRCIARGFVPVTTPDLIRHEVLEACGFNPRTEDPQTYYIEPHAASEARLPFNARRDPMQLCLSATAEFPLAAMYANEIVLSEKLPIKMVALGKSFRAEGQAGATNRGLYRVHQFTKVEMFSITAKGESDNALKEMVDIQKEIFEDLELCFRILNMPTHDLGAPAYQKYDMEAWMPGRKAWGEISSASNCTDYQTRRLNIRHFVSSPSPNTTDFVHTINGTACAVPRLIIALLETHQLEDGQLRIPEKLRPYFLGGNVDRLRVGKESWS